jgi:TetR/AcrR family transcriptional regulator, mexJK operon transcriptional repressor
LAQTARASNAGLSERKRRAIQDAGTAVFLRRGYESASMDAIAAEARVSKQTIYNHFRSKDELFKAIITDMTATLMAPLSVWEAARSTPERQLRSFAHDFLTAMLRPTSLSLYRLIVAESARFPELGAELFAVGAGKLIRVLADYLDWETKKGALAVDDPARAAEQFIGMLSGRVQLRALLDVHDNLSEAELDSRVEHAVSSFLKLYAQTRSEMAYSSNHPRLAQ